MFRYTYNTLVYGHEPLEIGITRLAKFGYDGVEFVGEPSEHDAREITEHLKKNDVVASSIISIFTPERDIVSSDEGTRRNAISYVKGNVDYAAALGADVVTFTPTACMKISPETDLAQEWAWAVEAARSVAGYAADHGSASPSNLGTATRHISLIGLTKRPISLMKSAQRTSA